MKTVAEEVREYGISANAIHPGGRVNVDGRGGQSPDISDNQVLENLGGPIQSSRVKCALLPILALRGAFRNDLGQRP